MLENILIGLGAEIAGKIIGQKLGPQFGGLATDVLNQLGTAFGVEPRPSSIEKAINAAPPKSAQEKVMAVEAETAAQFTELAKVIAEENEQMRLTNAQIDGERKESWFAWAWRPAGMWGLGVLWFWNIMVLHVINGILKWQLPQADMWLLFQLTALYSGLYMGGHTVKDFVAKRWAGK